MPCFLPSSLLTSFREKPSQVLSPRGLWEYLSARDPGLGGAGVSHCATQASFHKYRQIVFQNDYLFVLPPLVCKGFCFPTFPPPPTPSPTPACPQHLVWSGVPERRHLIARAHQDSGFASLSRPLLLQSAAGHDSSQSRNHSRQQERGLLGATLCFLLGKKNSPEIPSLLPLVSYWPAGATLSSEANL